MRSTNRNIAVWIAIAGVFASTANEGQAEERPNIVFIIADDLGWADVGFHGGKAPTPNLDRLAREGLELTRHYVAPVCSPTRAALHSGRYWSRFGVTSPQSERAFPWETTTLPRALKSVGYDTCLTGKWHLGSKPEWGPLKFGYDHSYGSLGGGVGPWNHRYKEGPYSHTWHRDDILIEEKGHVTDLIADEAVRWIESRKDAPFFLYVPLTAVHLPIKEPEELLSRVPAEITAPVDRHYAACIIHLDDAVGRIVAAIEKLQRKNDTLVVFTSDNGGSTSENNDKKYPPDDYPTGNLPGANLPLRGQKGDLYEGGIHVPTLAWRPGKLAPGKLDAPCHVADWMPTLCGLAGYRPDRDLKWDGRDIAPLLERRAAPEPRTLYFVGTSGRSQAIRNGDWKLIVYRDKKLQDELFDLANDPYEKANLAPKFPERVAQLKQLLAEQSANDNDARPEPLPSKRPVP